MTTRYSNTEYLTVLDPVGLENIGWEARAINPDDFSTVLAYVIRFTELTLTKANNDIGSGSISIKAQDPVFTDPLPLELDGTIADRECLWQFYRDGVLKHEWFGEDIQSDIVTEDGQLITQISGRTTEKILEWGVAVPGNVIVMVDDPKAKEPADWTDTHPGPSYNVEKKKLNGNIATLTIGTHAIKAGDHVVVKNVDGIFDGKPKIVSVTDTTISYGRVEDNVAETNCNGTVSGPSPKWDAPQVPKTIKDPMQFLDVPGITPFLWLIENIQSRGGLTFMSLTFDVNSDSYGNPWTDSSDIQIEPGETPLSLLQRLCDSLGWEFKMLHNFQLFIVQGGFGIHLEDKVKHFIGGSQQSHQMTSSTRDSRSVVFAQAQDGSIASAGASNPYLPHRREGWYSAGDAAHISGAQRVANASLKSVKDPVISRTVTVVDQPTRKLLEDYDINDWITIEDNNFKSYAIKIVGLALTVTQDNTITTELTIQTRREAIEVKLQKLIDKLGASSVSTGSSSSMTGPGGTGGGGSAKTLDDLQDVNAPAPDDGDILRYDEVQDRWQSRPVGDIVAGAVHLGDLIDVNLATTPPADGQVLVYDAAQGLWLPGDQSGGGGGGGSTADRVWSAPIAASQTAAGAEWVSHSGTWAFGGTYGIQLTGSGDMWMEHVAPVGLPAGTNLRAIKATVRLTSNSNWLGFGFRAANSGWGATGMAIGLNTNGTFTYDVYGPGGGTFSAGKAIALNTDYTIEVIEYISRGQLVVKLDGVLVTSNFVPSAYDAMGAVGLMARSSQGWFRDISVSYGKMPDPTLPTGF